MVWSALLRFRNAGRVRQVGFVTDRTFETETALEFLKRETGEKVQVLQQAFPSSELTAYCRHNGIQLQYVPIQYIFVPCSTVPQATTRGTVSVGGTSPSTNATGDLGGEQWLYKETSSYLTFSDYRSDTSCFKFQLGRHKTFWAWITVRFEGRAKGRSEIHCHDYGALVYSSRSETLCTYVYDVNVGQCHYLHTCYTILSVSAKSEIIDQ